MSEKRCFNGCSRTARPGYLTCEECERTAAKASVTPGTFGHALAKALVDEAMEPSDYDAIYAIGRGDAS